MEKTTSRKLARARLLERQQEAAAEREARERANLGDLTEFMVRSAQLDEVDDWLATKIEKVKQEAEQRRDRQRVAAGKALHAMRLRGETVSAIAVQTGISQGRVREFVRLGAEAAEADASRADDSSVGGADVPTSPVSSTSGHNDSGESAGAS